MGFLEKHRPHVFVVMPFGVKEVGAPSGSRQAVSADFDHIYRELFEPALQLAGCRPFRADQEPGAGDIRTDMFFELATADFVLADVSVLNPNVFYELGIRQGVAERGVILVNGGWGKRPFDIAPDRAFGYRGSLFETGSQPSSQEIRKEVEQLAETIRKAVATDSQVKSSPLYKELEGLNPPDLRSIRSARARYFALSFEHIADRLRAARKKALAGDILVLAEEAPNSQLRSRLGFAAARCLIDMRRFALARHLLEDVVLMDRENIEAASFLGLALNRLGLRSEAEVHLQRLIASTASRPEAHGALARVYKDQWRLHWEKESTPEKRRNKAAFYARIALQAANSYGTAYFNDIRSYYNGINVLALKGLISELGVFAEDDPAAEHFSHDRIAPVVQTAAAKTYENTKPCTTEAMADEHIWASATLGELAVLQGSPKASARYYQEAATVPGITQFALDSMLDQLNLYAGLGFQPEAVDAARSVILQALEGMEQPPAVRNVIFCSGHMVDTDSRPVARFPRQKEPAVAQWIRKQLADWEVGTDDLAICGGARGADLLFAEGCLARGARLLLLIPLPENEFLRESVDLPGSDWRLRFLNVRRHPFATVRFQAEELGAPSPKTDPFSRNNRWCLNTALAKAEDRSRLKVLLVWDGRSTGDGPGGTSHAVRMAREFAGDLRIADPLKLADPD